MVEAAINDALSVPQPVDSVDGFLAMLKELLFQIDPNDRVAAQIDILLSLNSKISHG